MHAPLESRDPQKGTQAMGFKHAHTETGEALAQVELAERVPFAMWVVRRPASNKAATGNQP